MDAQQHFFVTVDVQGQPLEVGRALAAVQHDEAGGVVLFVGVVRNHSEGRAVTGLRYEAYESMARTEMARIANEIVAAEQGVRVAAIHRVGDLAVGDLAIVCAASAPHRDQAFRACRLLIDRIKEHAPIWKREFGNEDARWVGWDEGT